MAFVCELASETQQFVGDLRDGFSEMIRYTNMGYRKRTVCITRKWTPTVLEFCRQSDDHLLMTEPWNGYMRCCLTLNAGMGGVPAKVFEGSRSTSRGNVVTSYLAKLR